MHRIHLAIIASAALLALPSIAAAADAEAGKTIYTTNCVNCHGASGKGDGPMGAALPVKPRDFSVGDFAFDADADGKKGTDADLVLVIKNGAAGYGGNPLMAPWSHLSDDDVANIVAYLRTLKQ